MESILDWIRGRLILEEDILFEMKQADPESPSVPFRLGRVELLREMANNLKKEVANRE